MDIAKDQSPSIPGHMHHKEKQHETQVYSKPTHTQTDTSTANLSITLWFSSWYPARSSGGHMPSVMRIFFNSSYTTFKQHLQQWTAFQPARWRPSYLWLGPHSSPTQAPSGLGPTQAPSGLGPTLVPSGLGPTQATSGLGPTQAPTARVVLPYLGYTSHKIQCILDNITWRWDALPLANLTQHSTLTKTRNPPKGYLAASTSVNQEAASRPKPRNTRPAIPSNSIDWPNKLLASINLWHTRRVQEAIKNNRDNKLQQDSGLVINDLRRPVHDRHTSQH